MKIADIRLPTALKSLTAVVARRGLLHGNIASVHIGALMPDKISTRHCRAKTSTVRSASRMPPLWRTSPLS